MRLEFLALLGKVVFADVITHSHILTHEPEIAKKSTFCFLIIHNIVFRGYNYMTHLPNVYDNQNRGFYW